MFEKKDFVKASGFVVGFIEGLHSICTKTDEKLGIAESINSSFESMYEALAMTEHMTVDIKNYSMEYADFYAWGQLYSAGSAETHNVAIGKISQFFASYMDSVSEEMSKSAMGLYNEIMGLIGTFICKDDVGCWGKFEIRAEN